MNEKFPEYKGLDLSEVNKEVLKVWEDNDTFAMSLKTREGHPSFVFYEGPPSANGMPGIHHVMARTLKDVICRYKTLQGFQVERKAGWDTHGLPVELGVEKKLGITKEDIGKSISVVDYNKECRADVMKFTKEWEDLTHKMGYWVDMENPYITYDNRYIETLWYLLKRLYDKGFLYKGYTIQPYSPAAGTGLSTHELNQPGCYRDVKDLTVVAQFKIKNPKPEMTGWGEPYFLAWTTTPWTLPSNTALCVGPKIDYVAVQTYNGYTGEKMTVVLAKALLHAHFNPKAEGMALEDYKPGDKLVPFKVVGEYKGPDLAGMEYEQLIPWVKPVEITEDGAWHDASAKAFRVILGDYVTTEDGTGIVHIAPTFGADDAFVAKAAGIPSLFMINKRGETRPMVDLTGKFYLMDELDEAFVKACIDVDKYKDYEGRWVKNAYDPQFTVDGKYDEKAASAAEHCWRTDKPVLYYPLDSWFIKTTAVRDRMLELNKTINWKPASTGEGRFGKWLENLVDWNLSRSRYWGTPLPIWCSEDGSEQRCIGSVAELMEEIEKSIAAGFMKENPFQGFTPGEYTKENYNKIDLHRPYVDDIVLVSPTGQKMYREKDLIDVWFDSGAMPYAQLHYPFEHKEDIDGHRRFPADFIAEGVDQTRGWFFTLHAIATMAFDSVAFKNIISNGLVLDAKGNKMSKRLGNAVDPFETIEKYGSDPLRWYMITNSQPWDNLKFDLAGVDEVKRKFFGTLYNTYGFFALYANVDHFRYEEADLPVAERPEIDRWILSLLNSLIKEVTEAYEKYEPTRAGRAIQDFVIENLSNWYVRLSRKRYWGGEYSADKISAYQTLYTCLETVAILASPIAPFYTDKLFGDLNSITQRHAGSVHLTDFPKADETLIDKALEERMTLAQQISSMVLGLRRKVQLRVRQPLSKLLIPILHEDIIPQLDAVKNIILSEVNVKEIEYITDTTGVLVKRIKPNFKTLGPKYGKYMKQISARIAAMEQGDIFEFEKNGSYTLDIEGTSIALGLEDVEILSEDIPGWLVANEGRITVALDINVTKELKEEGIARELINRIQNLRKESNFDVTDKIRLTIGKHPEIDEAVEHFASYIAGQVLAEKVELADVRDEQAKDIEIDEIHTFIKIEKQ